VLNGNWVRVPLKNGMRKTLHGRAQLTFLALKGCEPANQIRGHFVVQDTQQCFGVAGKLLQDEPLKYHESCCLEATAKYQITLLNYDTKEHYDIAKAKKAIESDAAVLETDEGDNDNSSNTLLRFETDKFLADNAAWEHCERYLSNFYLQLASHVDSDDNKERYASLIEEFDLIVCLGTMTLTLGDPRVPMRKD
jgi:hypothetical protein